MVTRTASNANPGQGDVLVGGGSRFERQVEKERLTRQGLKQEMTMVVVGLAEELP